MRSRLFEVYIRKESRCRLIVIVLLNEKTENGVLQLFESDSTDVRLLRQYSLEKNEKYSSQQWTCFHMHFNATLLTVVDTTIVEILYVTRVQASTNALGVCV